MSALISACTFQTCPTTAQNLLVEQHVQHAVDLAINEGRIMLYRQPIISATTIGKGHRFEVLCRLSTISGRRLPPNAWLPAIYSNPRLCEKLDWYVTRKALSLLQADQEMWINFSGYTITDDFTLYLFEEVGHQKLRPDQICIELTEHVPARRPAELQKARDAGFSVALDDVGTTGASLEVIAKTPVDWLKITGSLVCQADTDHHSAAIIKALIYLAKELNLGVAAEWVVNVEQAAHLFGLGVDLAQGFHLPQAHQGHPKPWG